MGIAEGKQFTQTSYLKNLIYKATSYDIVTTVVTNTYWIISEDIAIKNLSDLKKAGFNRLQISLDNQHQEFLTIKFMVNAIKTA